MRLFLFAFLLLQICAYGAVPKNPTDETSSATSTKEQIRKLYWLDFGIGFPQLTSLELALQPLRSWQIGFSYGMVPGSGSGGTISPKYSLPSQNVTLSTGLHLTVYEPSVTVSFSSLCPFIRYFPNTTGFYLQFTLGMLKVHNVFSSSLHDVTGTQIPNAAATGTIDLTQYLPTLSIGHLFSSRLFFYGVNMGLSYISNLSIQSKFESQIPDSLGGNIANQAATDQLNSRNDEAASRATEEFRQLVTFLPSLQLSFGILF